MVIFPASAGMDCLMLMRGSGYNHAFIQRSPHSSRWQNIFKVLCAGTIFKNRFARIQYEMRGASDCTGA
jgi:hypothetical protein